MTTDWQHRWKMVEQFVNKHPKTEYARQLILSLQVSVWPNVTRKESRRCIKRAEKYAKKLGI